MFVKPQFHSGILTVLDTFAHLQDVSTTNDLTFEFKYTVKQREALQNGALAVNVTAYAKNNVVKPLLELSRPGLINTRALINNIKTQALDAKSAVKNQDEQVIAARVSDVTAAVNTQLASSLISAVPSPQIQGMQQASIKAVSVNVLKQQNDCKPVLNYNAMRQLSLPQSSGSLEPSEVAFDVLMREGRDPSFVADLTHRSVTPFDAIGGLLKRIKAPEVSTSNIVKLTNVLLQPRFKLRTTSDITDNAHVELPVSIQQDALTISIVLTLPAAKMKLDGRQANNIFVRFDLINSKTKAIVDTSTKPLDVAKHIQLFNTPRKPPIVRTAKSEVSTRANLEIKQVDPGAVAVKVFKKSIKPDTGDIEDYQAMGDFPLRAVDQPMLLQVELPVSSIGLYRVVPVGPSGVLGFEYTNVVVRPKRFKRRKHAVLAATPVQTGMRLEVFNVPDSVVGAQVIKRDLTLFQKKLMPLGPVNLFQVDQITIVDVNAIDGHIYEYAARLVYKDGATEVVSNVTLEYHRLVEGLIATTIEALSVSHTTGQPEVTFNVSTTVPNTDLDGVKLMLEQQNLAAFFKDDILKERDKLKELIAHSVVRVDLTNGRRDDMGIITSNVFSDFTQRATTAAPPLAYGHRYRYEVSTLLRAPETMFEQFVKTVANPTGGASYTFRPSKNLHPITLKRGNILPKGAATLKYSRAAMAFGRVGNLTKLDVAFDREATSIIDASAAQFDDRLNVVTWRLQGDIGQIDHFVVIKEVHGVRTIIGKAHSEFQQGNCQYFHTLTVRDTGSMAYVIVPVFSDYRLGDEAMTNTVIV